MHLQLIINCYSLLWVLKQDKGFMFKQNNTFYHHSLQNKGHCSIVNPITINTQNKWHSSRKGKMNLWSLHFLGPCTDDWLPPYLIGSMYLDAFLEAFRVSDVTTLVFFYLGFRLLLVELWCALGFCVVLPDWCGAAGVKLCCCV